MTEKYLGTLRTPEAVHAFVENTAHLRCWPEMAKGDKEGRDLPRAMYLGGCGIRVRIPSEVWKLCSLKPGGEFDRRMYRYDPGTSEQETSQEPAAPGRRYRHRASGGTYTVLGVGRMQAKSWIEQTWHHEPQSGSPPAHTWSLADMQEVIIYQGEDGKLWVRPAKEFNDGRFEEIE